MLRRPTCGCVRGAWIVVGFGLLAPGERTHGQATDRPPVNLTFVNQSGGPVEMFWIGPKEERSLGVIADGARSTANTHLGHVWVIRDANRRERVRLTVNTAGDITSLIGPPAGASPAPAPGPASVTTGSAPTNASSPGSVLDAEEIAALVALHNKARREVGIEPIRWSPELAGFAQAWADECARTGSFAHRPRDGAFKQEYGENIATFIQGLVAEGQGANLWYDEKSKYTPGTQFDFLSGVGHYTQMVWRKTTEFGAGKAQFQSGPFKGMWILVANYNPAGNQGQIQPDGKFLCDKPY
jgi:pathogenesis-related protein 1